MTYLTVNRGIKHLLLTERNLPLETEVSLKKSRYFFSVVIPVRDRWESLEICLDSLAQQYKPPEFEVIIVDDGSVQSLPLKLLLKFSSLKIRFVQQIALGISAARNAGIKASTGENILFIDSDCFARKDFLRAMGKTILNYPDDNVFQAKLTSTTSTTTGRMEGLRLTATQTFLQAPSGYIGYINTSAVVVRRKYLHKFSNFFDVRMLRGEDTMLLAQLVKEGHLPRYAPEGVVQHCPVGSTLQYLFKHFSIGFNTGLSRRYLTEISGIRMSATGRIKLMGLMWRNAAKYKGGVKSWIMIWIAYLFETCGRIAYRLLGMKPGRTQVLNVGVDAVHEGEVIARVIAAAEERKGQCITYLTAWTLVQAVKDSGFAKLLQAFDICYADGMGVVAALFVTKLCQIKKVTANDFFDKICREMANRGLSIALIGGEKGIVKSLVKRIKNQQSNLRIAFYESGYFSSEKENHIITQIHDTSPNIVFVGMGQPRQEEWVTKLRSEFPQTVFFCVGGLFDFLTGNSQNPPHWVRSLGFEWVFRLMYDPRRMWRRYLLGIPMLGAYIFRSYLKDSLKIGQMLKNIGVYRKAERVT